MNIGIDINSLLSSSRTGVAEYTFELLNALFSIDKKNQYYLFSNSFRKNIDDEMWNQKNVHFIHTRVPNKLFHLFLQLTGKPTLDTLLVKKYEKKNTVKIGHLDVFFSPNIGFTSLSKRCKRVLTVHDLSFEIFPHCFSLKMRLWHKILRPQKQCERANSILVPSHNTKNDLVDMYSIDTNKIHVLPLGLSNIFSSFETLDENYKEKHSTLLKEKYNLPNKFIFFLGTLEPRKNIETVVEAFEIFQKTKEGEGVHLVIAGAAGWKNAKLQKMIQKNSLIHSIGYILAEEKPFLYRASKLFLYPSLYEGFGLPVLEAMASGVPVITSNRSSLPEITNGAAYLIDPRNVQELVTGMQRLLGADALRKTYIQKGLEQSKHFSWEDSARKFLDLVV